MSVKHAIRKNGSNKTKIVDLTPSKAIRYACIECMGFQPGLVQDCSNPLCPLYPFRLGKLNQRHG